MTGLLGVNGAGKSTLIKLAVGQLRPDSGRVELHGTTVAKCADKIGYCPQDPNFPGRFTAEEFLEYLTWLRRIPRAKRREVVNAALRWADLEDQRDHKLSTLSGGMLRRLAVAQAVMGEPELVVLDEPTSGLDPEQRVRLRELLKSLSGSTPVLLSSHLIEDIEHLCDRVLVINDGQIVGDLATVEARTESLEQAFLKVMKGGRK